MKGSSDSIQEFHTKSKHHIGSSSKKAHYLLYSLPIMCTLCSKGGEGSFIISSKKQTLYEQSRYDSGCVKILELEFEALKGWMPPPECSKIDYSNKVVQKWHCLF